MTISLIIATYNWPGALRICVLSAINQTRQPDEIIIADDGSGLETKALINELRQITNIPIVHVWQEDDGFRLAEIRNKAFAVAKGDYLLQIDGDIILHKKYIADQEKFAQVGSFVVGSRCMVNADKTHKLIQNKRFILCPFEKGVRNLLNGIRIPVLSKRMDAYKSDDIYSARGCNMAFWRSDIFEVNGYNEDFRGWGREDTDLAMRLMNKGLRKRFIKFAGVIYHLHHNVRINEEGLKINHQLLLESQKRNDIRCINGLDQYK